MSKNRFKFRVWDKDNKLFLKSDDGLNFYMEGDMYGQLPVSTLIKNNRCFFVQQFTGLLDKNNKEIYEGDILGYNLNGIITHKVEVFYNEGDAAFELRTKLFIGPLRRTQLNNVSILGNIFENPDLL